ncbi:MAG: ribonuclease J [Pseudomonadota bacterium]
MRQAKKPSGKRGPRGDDDKHDLVFTALGGLGEIGMNVYLYGAGTGANRSWLMVDLGLTFPGDGEPGVDVVLPDVSTFKGRTSSLKGIVLTHAHEDHLGALIELWPQLRAPVYATPFTAAMLRAKMQEYGAHPELEITEVPLGGRIDVGPFNVEFIAMAHSIPEPNALAIRVGGRTLLHSGDWKLDDHPVVGGPTDEARLRALGDEGIDVLMCDSTNAFRDGTSPSESDIAKTLERLIKEAPHRVAVTTFASNVGRIKAVADATYAAGRQLVVCGRALHRIIDVSKETGYLPEDFRYSDQREFGYLERKDVVALCTGSQGESRAAMARVASDDHPDVSLTRGDRVIFSSRTIPGNEKSVGAVQNALEAMGCEVITDAQALVHVTGHPRREELRAMYGWLKPKALVPMHGEARHLNEQVRLAKEAGITNTIAALNGELVSLSVEPMKIIDDVPVGRLYRDGRLILPSDAGPVRERQTLSNVGIVVVGVTMTAKGELATEPDVVIDGVPYENQDGDAMEDVILDAVEGAIASLPRGGRRNGDTLRRAVEKSARGAVAQVWGKRPIAKAMVMVLER